ncbi:dynamin family protein [Bacillus massilinigeriensis]|uniref:dynamin family protein n=1 Tax=Bacillus mediterraneensis TaxID=1805474 RepID=UPI000AD7C9D5|nr:dynamin family protein [Bacillus mediterraneensis]
MGQSIVVKRPELLQKLGTLHDECLKNEDKKAVSKILELGRKVQSKEFVIAFCGHFSAGKSSMINRLVGNDILPSSPIPTSANLVKVRSGDEYARVFFKDGKPRLYPAPYDYEEVKRHCRDGDSIRMIEISTAETALLKDCVILDTPGIDSADDAHRIATESALHLADLVFYVMDYNHVQSEVNFMFAKDLCEAGKELYLIVNQIDKHNEGELRFNEFQDSVFQSFAAWGVHPEGIFYTSLRQPETSGNDFKNLQQFIKDKISNKEPLLIQSVHNAAVNVALEHLEQLDRRLDEELSHARKTLKDLPEAEWDDISEKLLTVQESVGELERIKENSEIELDTALTAILKNAYLMPYETRELAENYLESMESGFKAGLFFAKQKTREERQRRLQAFHSDLMEKIKTQIEWHIKEHIQKWMREKGVHDNELTNSLQGYEIVFPPELLAETIKNGASLSGDYVLVYTNDVAEAVKKEVKKQFVSIRQKLAKLVSVAAEKELHTLREEEHRYENLNAAYKKLETCLADVSLKKQKVLDVINSEYTGEVSLNAELLFAPEQYNEEVVYSLSLENDRDHISQKEKVSMGVEESEAGEIANDLDESHKLVKNTVWKLRNTANGLEGLPGLEKLAAELTHKAERLENRKFTVALFGAFSAGKSSFANALIGDKLLPVSPNPTTATINKIMPVDALHPHGTVVVKAKEESQLLDEVNRSLKLFGSSASNLKDAIIKIAQPGFLTGETRPEDRLHASFLKAFSKGFNDFSDLLGEQFILELESFEAYVAAEEKSCFVEWIEVYYDCKLTREGITLVDTPGADSINARHTGVAFEYIKNSDAILFVTYYNHAFSRADREFLIQLGRVKDSFELDKMFFIVNAVDLASSQEEMGDVLSYVGEQLVKYGIRKPTLFPVSSIAALKAKMENEKTADSRFVTFEKAFYSFIANDLARVAIDSAEAKWLQAIDQVSEMVASAKESSEKKQKRIQELTNKRELATAAIREGKPDTLIKAMEQELEELLFYLKQRVFFRFGEFFKEAFNPAVLKDGSDIKKQLDRSLDDLLKAVGFDLSQELRASTVRMDTFIVKKIVEYQRTIMDRIREIHPSLFIPYRKDFHSYRLDFEEAFKELDRKGCKKHLTLFKNPKHFFEKDGKKLLSEALEQALQTPTDEYLQTENHRVKSMYAEVLQTHFTRLTEEMEEEVIGFFTSILMAMETTFPLHLLEEKLSIIKQDSDGAGE